MPPAIVRSTRWALPFFVVVLAGTATIALPGSRTAVLRSVGWALVADDPLEPADMIVVTVDAGPAGILEAADLVHSGAATRVAVFADPPDELERELIRRGLPHDDAAVRAIAQLRLLGVPNVEQIPVPEAVAGTEDEGRALPDWFDRRSFRSVVVVSGTDHSRRLRRVLRRDTKGHATRVTVRFARHSRFDPDRWWQTRNGLRTAVIELQKLILDIASHPFS